MMPKSQVLMHGSRETGLAVPTSDLDLIIQIPEFEKSTEVMSRKQVKLLGRKNLHRLRRAFQSTRNPRYGKIELIMDARVALLQVVDRPTGLPIQIISRPRDNNSVICKYHMEEYPQLRPLHMILSASLRNRFDFSGANGGIGSYGLFTMILAALGHVPRPFGENELGAQLKHVLSFWARADIKRDGYSADPPCIFRKYSRSLANGADEETKDVSDGSSMAGIRHIVKLNLQQLKSGDRLDRLCLQDPANPLNDLGRGRHDVRRMIDFFQRTLMDIEADSAEWDRKTDEERRLPGHSKHLSSTDRERHRPHEEWLLLRSLMGPDWKAFARARERIQKAAPDWI